MTDVITAKPRRRFLRFSLRTLLVALTVLLVWLGVQVNRANRQKALVRWVTEKGGSIMYDWEFREDNGIQVLIGDPDNGPPGPAWVRRQIGDEYFQSPIDIAVAADDLSKLAGHSSLRRLNIVNGPAHDLTPLASLNGLKVLCLFNTQVRDLSPLVNLPNLEVLELGGSPVSDLSPLSKLTKLEELYLANTAARDLSPLTRLPNLRILHLDGTQVTDLKPLRRLTSLTDLRIHDQSVSPEQIRALQRALPSCHVSR